MDDQLEKSQALSLLKAAKQDPELQAKLRRYALISQAMKTEQCAVADLDFADKIHQRLKQEPTYLLPVKAEPARNHKAALAIAASVVLAVVGLSLSQWQMLTAPQSGTIEVAQRSTQAERNNAEFKEYLQAHDNVWYVNNTVGNQSQVRMVSYQHK